MLSIINGGQESGILNSFPGPEGDTREMLSSTASVIDLSATIGLDRALGGGEFDFSVEILCGAVGNSGYEEKVYSIYAYLIKCVKE